MSAQRNAASGRGNTDPRLAYRQQAAVQLTPRAVVWLNGRLGAGFARHGRLSQAELERMDWPAVPTVWHVGRL